MPPLRVLTCLHAGRFTGARTPCVPCGGKTALKIYECSRHRITTEAHCRDCPDYSPRPGDHPQTEGV
jgi:hypothetical protein